MEARTRTMRPRARRHDPSGRPGRFVSACGQGTVEGGQSLVEFSLVLMPLFFILLGIIQFGFIFNSYVTLSNAVREGARTGTIYLYSASQSKAQNDLARDESMRTAVIGSMNLLGKTSPRFTTTAGTWSQSRLRS